MSLHNILILNSIFLLLICCFGLIRQKYYLITASANKIYRAVTLISSALTLAITFFISTNVSQIVLGILYSVIFVLLSFMRKGISKKAFIGHKGDYCKLSKVDSVKLAKKNNQVEIIYSHHMGESYMYFNLDQYNKLKYVLREIISEDKV